MSKVSFISPLNQDSIIKKIAVDIKSKHKNVFGRFKKLSIFFCGFSCCNSELEEIFSSKYDLEKLGMKLARNPQSANVMIFSGLFKTAKQKNFLKEIYNQMRSPKFTVSVGSCSNGEGIYSDNDEDLLFKENGLNADIYVAGCPPSTEAILYSILKLKQKISN